MKKVLCVCLFIGISLISFSQFGEIYEGTQYTDWRIASADLDGDGDNDVLIGYHDGDGILWYENIDGQGLFDYPKYVTESVVKTVSLTTGDMDGDGDIDVLSASEYDKKYAWYENLDGKGSFGPQNIITVDNSGAAQQIISADLDNDADLDVIVASRKKVSWFENVDGEGTFGSENTIRSATGSQNYLTPVSSGDIDGDNDVDILITSGIYPGKSIMIFKNNGTGNFNLTSTILNVPYTTGQIELCDIDEDGDDDLLCNKDSSNNMFWYENTDGNGTYGQQYTIIGEIEIMCFSVGDMDGDDDMDIVFASDYYNRLGWYENLDGDGNFSYRGWFPDKVFDPRDLCLVDLDGDGDNDVLAASASDYSAWYENEDGAGNFSRLNFIMPPMDLKSADLDGDGYNDVISSFSEDKEIGWFINDRGLGIFSDQLVVLNFDSFIKGFQTGDVDGDGDIDIVSSSTDKSQTSWYTNLDGSGNFGSEKTIGSSFEPYEILLYDLNMDGNMDIIATSIDSGVIAWYDNYDGEGTFGEEKIISNEMDYPASIFCADLDGDQDKDLIVADARADKISWFENSDGNGNFGSENLIIDQVDGAWRLSANDIDNDNDIDIVYCSTHDRTLNWLENLNNTGFGDPILISDEIRQIRHLDCTDIDHDDEMEVLVVRSGDMTRFEFLGEEFGPEIDIYTGHATSNAYLKDLTGNNLNDIVFGSSDHNTINWRSSILLPVGLFSKTKDDALQAYPNPTNGKLTLTMDSNISEPQGINIYKPSGKKVYSSKLDFMNTTLDLSNFSSGIYIVEVMNKEGSIYKKIIIE